MQYFTVLDRLPADVQFPPEFDGRISYDAKRRRLTFRGFMSKSEYDSLNRISADWAYRRALEDLFRLTAREADRPRRSLRRMVGAVTGLF